MPGRIACYTRSMPSYVVKALVQGTISLLPGSYRLNRLFQEHITRSTAVSEAEFSHKLDQARRHLDHLGAHATPAAGWQALELGTGLAPVVPVALALCGAERVWSIDRTRLFGPRELRQTLHLFDRQASGCLAARLPAVREERLDALRSVLRAGATPDALAEQLGVHFLTRDARATGLPSGTIDVFASNNTLEHIPARTLHQLLVEFRRVARPGAISSHFVDMSDHYAHGDPSITPYNYLRFGPAMWRLLNNPLQYQNRLRPRDYQAIHQAAGWDVVAREVSDGPLAQFRTIRVARRFQSYPEAELRALTLWLVARPADRAS